MERVAYQLNFVLFFNLVAFNANPFNITHFFTHYDLDLSKFDYILFVGRMQDEWKRADFIFQEQLGVGSSGVVYKALEKESERIVAIKVIAKNKLQTSKAHKRLQREIEVHCRLKDPAICRLYGYFED